MSADHLPEQFIWSACQRGQHAACPGVHPKCSPACTWPPCACQCHERANLDDLLGSPKKSNSDIEDLLG